MSGMEKTTILILVFAIAIVGCLIAVMLLNTAPVTGKCSVDIKWENYSCMWNDNELISCPHPTHIECEGQMPFVMVRDAIIRGGR